jgi:outer membrane protein assembly factor BamB
MPSRAVPLALMAVAICAAENWPQFRGPRGDGTSSESFSGPLRQHWKVQLPGPGHSSPVVWGDRIFLTAFERETSILRRLAGTQGRLLVLCLNRKGGRLEWQREVPADDIEKTTSVNKPASPTPATDGTRVYTYFGSVGLAAFNMDGKPAWTRKIGPFPHHMGTGSSPILAGDRIILNVEGDGPSFLYSIDKSTGRVAWRVPRKTRQAAYSTPVLWDRTIAVAGYQSVMAYSLYDGHHLWTASGLADYVVPTPIVAAGLLLATTDRAVLALRHTGEIAWQGSRGGAYVASPIHAAGKMITVNQNCVVSTLDAQNGRVLSQQRLPTTGECFASPVAASAAIYAATTAGELFTLGTLQKLELHDRIMASPAIANGVMYVRSDSHLYALLP